MKLKEEIQQDIEQLLQDLDDMLPERKKEAVFSLVNKYCMVDGDTVLWGKEHFDKIKKSALGMYQNRNFPKQFNNSHHQFLPEEAVNVCLVEATITHLYSNDCLKKLPKFNLKEE